MLLGIFGEAIDIGFGIMGFALSVGLVVFVLTIVWDHQKEIAETRYKD